jgi:predicted transcriptional regulator
MRELVGDRAIVLAIHPEHAARIYTGEKTAELRRASPSARVTLAFIYETAPESAITGVMLVEQVSRASPPRIWRQFRRRLCISELDFQEYLRGCKAATVYEVSHPFRFPRHVPLVRTTHLRRPPQSYSYIDRMATSQVLRDAKRSGVSRASEGDERFLLQSTLREWEGRASSLGLAEKATFA